LFGALFHNSTFNVFVSKGDESLSVLHTSFANCCELLAMEVILMYFYPSVFAESEPDGIISALAR
jgi:hypothetical protein